MSDSNHPQLIDLDKLDSKKYLMRFRACCVMLNYGKYDGLNIKEIENFLEEYEFNMKNNIDLNIVIYMIKVCSFI